jgi:hypothetical protein
MLSSVTRNNVSMRPLERTRHQRRDAKHLSNLPNDFDSAQRVKRWLGLFSALATHARPASQ